MLGLTEVCVCNFCDVSYLREKWIKGMAHVQMFVFDFLSKQVLFVNNKYISLQSLSLQ